jgi:hypothetical protein
MAHFLDDRGLFGWESRDFFARYEAPGAKNEIFFATCCYRKMRFISIYKFIYVYRWMRVDIGWPSYIKLRHAGHPST